MERGKPVEERVRDVERFWNEGLLDRRGNVQFGEGGAGTFSDGKLTTRLNSPWMRLVLQTLVDFGAPEEILMQAKPHVGSDRLRLVLISFRNTAGARGRYPLERRLTDLEIRDGWWPAVFSTVQRILPATLVLAPGHSARDTYRMLHAPVFA